MAKSQLIILILLLMALLFFLTNDLYTNTLPIYLTALGASPGVVGFLVGAKNLVSVLARPYFGLLAQNRGRVFVMVSSLILTCGMAVGFTLSNNLFVLGFFRIVHGISLAAGMLAVQALAADFAPRASLGRGMAIVGFSDVGSFTIGPALGYALYLQWGFVPFNLFVVLLSLAALALLPLIKKRVCAQDDPVGEESYVARFADYLLLLRENLIRSGFVLMFSGAVVFSAVIAFLPVFARSEGLNPGIFFMTLGLTGLAGRYIGGILSDRLGRPAIILPAVSLMALGVFLLGTKGLSQTLFIVSAMCVGTGLGAFFTNTVTFAIDCTPVTTRSLGITLFTGAFDLGLGCGSLFLGKVVGWVSYSVMFRFTGAAFGLLAVAMALGILGSIRRRQEFGMFTEGG